VIKHPDIPLSCIYTTTIPSFTCNWQVFDKKRAALSLLFVIGAGEGKQITTGQSSIIVLLFSNQKKGVNK